MKTKTFLLVTVPMFLLLSLIGWIAEPLIPTHGWPIFFKGMALHAKWGGLMLMGVCVAFAGLLELGRRIPFTFKSDWLVPAIMFGGPSVGTVVFIVAILLGAMHPWCLPLLIVALVGVIGCPLLAAFLRGMEPDMRNGETD